MAREIRFSCGIWGFTPCVDRFCTRGYRPQTNLDDLFTMASRVEDLTGVEIHYPSYFKYDEIDRVQQLARQYKLKITTVSIDLFSDPRWKMGSLSIAEENERREAIKVAKEAIDAAEALGADDSGLWLGQDGYDYPFQVDYAKSLDRLVTSVREIADYKPRRKIALEYKLKEPRTHLFVSTAAKTLFLLNLIDRDNVGSVIDLGHAYMAYENPAESVVMLGRAGKLLGVHLNDNYREWDHDMIVGSVHLWELMEFLFWLREVNYQGWHTLDIFPYREDPVMAATQSIKQIKLAYKLIDKVGRGRILSALEEGNATETIALLRESIEK